jgi:hypothetical protein
MGSAQAANQLFCFTTKHRTANYFNPTITVCMCMRLFNKHGLNSYIY